MSTLLQKLFQLQCIVSLIENNSLYKEKKYQRNPSYKLHDILDQVNSKFTAVKGGVLSGLWLINDENVYVCINGKNVEIMRLFFMKLSLMIRKDICYGSSGVPQLRFIIWIQIYLYLVTKRS